MSESFRSPDHQQFEWLPRHFAVLLLTFEVELTVSEQLKELLGLSTAIYNKPSNILEEYHPQKAHNLFLF